MALSDRERDLLAEMENRFAQEDPSFAQKMSSASETDQQVVSKNNFSAPSPQNIILAGLAAIVGIGIFFLGVSLKNPLVGILGFIVIVAGIVWAISRSVVQGSGDQEPTEPSPQEREKARLKKERRSRPWLD